MQRICGLLSVVMLLSGWGIAQSSHRFNTLNMEQGLSSNFAWSIGQDKYGFMWIGTTNGLNRFDGHHIKQYFPQTNDSFSIPGNIIYWIHTDRSGDIWFACGQQGIRRYNYVLDRFETLPAYDSIKKQKGYAAPVWRICSDLQGRLYIACGAALFRYHLATGKFEDLTPLFHGDINDVGVAMVVPQHKSLLWILTDDGLFRYDLAKEEIRKIPFDKKRLGVGSAAMHDAKFTSQNQMVITTPRAGMILFDTEKEQFHPLQSAFDGRKKNSYNEMGGVLKDHRGRFWLVSSTYGLIEYFPATQGWHLLKTEASYPYPYLEQEGKGMNTFEDRDGNIWYGTSQRGVVWFNPSLNFISLYQRNYADSNSLASDAVYSFAPGNSSQVLVGTGKGLSILDTATHKIHNYPVAGASPGVSAASVRAMTIQGDTIIMATTEGVSFFNRKTGRFEKINEYRNNVPANVRGNHFAAVFSLENSSCLLLDQQGRFCKYDYRQKQWYYEGNSSDPLFTFHGVRAAAWDTISRALWFQGADDILYQYDSKDQSITRHRAASLKRGQHVRTMAVQNEWLWLGTSQGLIRYHKKSTRSAVYRIPASSQEIVNIATSGTELVWIATSKEVVRINQEKNNSVLFKLNTVLPFASIQPRSMWIDACGNIWLGTNQGICKIDHHSFRPDTRVGLPRLTSFKVFDEPKYFARPYSDLSELELQYNENFFSFEFSALNYNPTGVVQYAYRLDPFDKDWRLTEKNYASYTNVPPGTYQLRMRTEYGLDYWRESQPIAVVIRAPFWQQWWFLLLMVLGCAALFYYLYLLRLKQQRRKSMEATVEYFANSEYGENSVAEICWDIARNCISQLQLEDCVVYLYDERDEMLQQKAALGRDISREQEIENPLKIPLGEGIVGVAAAGCKSVVVDDTSRDHRYIRDKFQGHSELAVPIIHEGKAIGVIDSEHSQKRFFTEDHVKVFSTIAAISAKKIAEAKAEEAARNSALQLLEIKKLYAESQLMALRAQMNPHFVFNCLNAIQECIVTKKYGEASLYLNKFAKLFRTVLNNSGKNLVTIAEEIEVLKLYLYLEHMRFEQSFEYHIETDAEIDPDEILIPSMLLQPFVENALWHGLMHKLGNRRLCIKFSLISRDVYSCMIDDNGIGREKAMALKQQQQNTKRHISRGMAICQNRIELLQKEGMHASLKIVDKLEKGESAGTRVILELSTELE